MPDIEREVRAIVDGVPPPDDPAPEDGDHDDGRHHIQMFAVEPPLLVVQPNGGVQTYSLLGSLIGAAGVLSAAVSAYVATAWLWERATPLGVATAIVSIVFGIGGATVLVLATSAVHWLAGRWRAWWGRSCAPPI